MPISCVIPDPVSSTGQALIGNLVDFWIPAFAGMTEGKVSIYGKIISCEQGYTNMHFFDRSNFLCQSEFFQTKKYHISPA